MEDKVAKYLAFINAFVLISMNKSFIIAGKISCG